MLSLFQLSDDQKNIKPSSFQISAILFVLCSFFQISSLSSAPELAAPSPTESAKLFILDASGSMNEYLGIYQKIHLAKKYVRHYADQLPEETEIGFIAYGNRLPGCQSSRLYQPLEKGNKPQFRNKLFGLTPSGATPLAESIRIAGDYISKRKIPTELILVTDGVESCYGDPEKELKILKQKGIDFKMHVLGLGLKPDEKKIMESLAKSGNGKYYNVDGDSDFYSAVDDLLKQESVAKRAKTNTDRKTPKVRIIQIDKLPTDREENLYGVRFEFENANSNNQCVLLNLKQVVSPSSDPKDWNVHRASHPENVIRTDQACFVDQKGDGIFKIHLPKNLSLNLELELWDMQGIPNPVDKSGERSVKD
ncbi:VWA domain-containing protein [Leptospira semungkisensis]|uniref:VWA domain-containing protein n=1 Tax=Leptospira semungkisensis TaxID=2484985 RepID=A0A4R9G7P7_9LEPT|nr:VWA domain-containing protein [Leptospira semungkisensis]TGK07275.1 VWA domain-containing protein [Leptospira semungkisensis]